MSFEIQLEHGIDKTTGELVRIESVESGIKCNCSCPACGENLVAKKGKIKSWHFAHESKKSCEYAGQTALHLMAKDVIAEYGVYIPTLRDIYKAQHYRHEWNYFDLIECDFNTGTVIKFDTIFLEKKVDDFIPDIIGHINGKNIIIEIAVTHFCNDEKIEKIRSHDCIGFEIDLSHIYKHGNRIEKEDLYKHLTNRELVYRIKLLHISIYDFNIGEKGTYDKYLDGKRYLEQCIFKHSTDDDEGHIHNLWSNDYVTIREEFYNVDVTTYEVYNHDYKNRREFYNFCDAVQYGKELFFKIISHWLNELNEVKNKSDLIKSINKKRQLLESKLSPLLPLIDEYEFVFDKRLPAVCNV